MKHTSTLSILGSALMAALLSSPTQAQTAAEARKEPGLTASNAISIRGCRPPGDAKEAQVLTFDPGSLEAKLAVSLGKDEFKVVTVKLWDRPDDPRPLVPVIEAARITQGKLQFYTPNLNADPQPIHDKDFAIVASLGGAQVCWANPSSLIKEGGRTAGREATPEAASDEAALAPRTRGRGRRF
jgi:hypothetical protein